MIKINLATTLQKLNSVCRYALEDASANSIEREETEVSAKSFLSSCLDNPFGDVRIILDKFSINHEELKQTLLDVRFNSNMNVGGMPTFSPLLIEVFQEAWLVSSLELGQTKIRSGVVFIAILANAPRYLSGDTIDLLSKINTEVVRKDFTNLTSGSSESEAKSSNNKNKKNEIEATPIEKFATNITEQAELGNIDPVIARDKEIDIMINVLSRRRKNNPIAVGDAGVGKSALIEGLALRIINKKVPDHLKNVEIWGLDIGALQSGASIKGEFEKRLKSIINFVKDANGKIILFIDEAHTLIGAGGEAGGSDAANLLKPALARGELRTIAATTWSEYKKFFEKDPALSRRFQVIKLDEPTVENATKIIRGVKSIYEKEHGVYITEEALQAVTSLSARYISGKKLPDKAIDVLDTACARVSGGIESIPNEISHIENKTHETQLEIDEINRDHDYGEEIDSDKLKQLKNELKNLKKNKRSISNEYKKQRKLVDSIIKLRGKISSDKDNSAVDALKKAKQSLDTIKVTERLLHAEVGEFQIAEVVADLTGIPVNSITSNELEKIKNLPQILDSEIKGQSKAINTIHRFLLTSTADLRRKGTPLGSFLLVGPSGVGKTETAIQLATHLFGGKQFMTVINMSEYQEKHTVSRLIGSPPGYVGYGEGGLLTEAIRQKPYSIVLLDEVEKAHPDVLNLFYQAFDKGELADGEGRLIDCKNILFMLTSNIGFDSDSDDQDNSDETILRQRLLTFFKPALLARMQVIPFNYLTDDVMKEIVTLKIDRLINLLKNRYNAELNISDKVIEHFQSQCSADANGARLLDSILEGELLPPLSLAILNKIAQEEQFTKIVIDHDEDYLISIS